MLHSLFLSTVLGIFCFYTDSAFLLRKMTDKTLVAELTEEIGSIAAKPTQKLISSQLWNDLGRQQTKVSEEDDLKIIC